MQTHVILLAQIFAFGDAVRDVIARHAAQQINRALRQLFRAEFFRRGIDGVTYPVNDFQAAIQFLLLRVVERGPLNFTAAFRSFVALPECPAALGVPAFAFQLNMFDTQTVDFPRGALDKAQIVFSIKV
ncbi:hypothetical protein D3C81_1992100 [compost metagenome]